ncbi:hypothetical protein EYB45_03590 [Erythrobacteraceae bacterium CFH 75059]|nr:hypothetical protein EYB45_03590 [Erythrobacteraceae bacterium CFH 75059]
MLVLTWQLARAIPVVEPLGGWAPPLGIALRADGFAAAFLVMTALVAAVVGAYAATYFAADPRPRRAAAFWPLFYAVWTAVNLILLGRDLFNLYVGLELLTLAGVAMVALDGRAATLAAALRYLLFALFGSVTFLIGAALLYGRYATLDMELLAVALAPDTATVAAAALISVGLLAKAAIFPFHAWLPPAHAGAPAPASALLSALVVKASVLILFRLWFDVLPPLAGALLNALMGGLGAMAVLYGSVQAIRQDRLKPIVAYSTVAQLGYLLLAFPLAGAALGAQPWSAGAWTGAVFHALSHGLAKAAMFLAAGTIMLAAGTDRLDRLGGVAKAVPVASFAFVIAAVSLMGLPPSGGFLAKYLLLTYAFAAQQAGWAAVMVVGGLLAAVYLARPVNALMRAAPAEGARFARVPAVLQLAPLLLALAAMLLGILSFEPYRLIQVNNPAAAHEGLQ